MRRFISAGNWKLNKSPQEAKEFLQELIPEVANIEKVEIIVAPPTLSVMAAREVTQNTNIQVAAQNCYSKDSGAYTGETSPLHLAQSGITHVIIGHSERRDIFYETDRDVNAKIKAALSHGLIPIVCIGEHLDERDAGKVEEVLERQITFGLEGIDITEKLILAYEPVWAIGTGKTASKEDAQAAHQFIRSVIRNMFSSEIAEKIRILYGGSVKPENIEGLISMPDVDGALIGGASLKVDSFSAITRSIENAMS
ncbi:MAG: triose-phosphate isomerase [Candidatus Hydrogenedentota bacterium]|nr:MAG: triose-phosphate isomerase [Candidatus Hydrogenedentota bacterium]